MSNSQPTVKVSKLNKTYYLGKDKIEVCALCGVSFQVMPGEFVAIMGPSGCGKSTLMNQIGCLDHPSSGEVLIDGINVSNLDDKALAKVRNVKIGFVFQTFNLLPRFTAEENVELPLIYARVPRVKRHEIAHQMLAKVGLADRVHHKPTELSGGQVQKVAIARALINNPSLIMADEPTGNLDSKSGKEIMTIFQKLNDQGATVLMVTHDYDIAHHAKRVIRLKDGLVLEDTVIEQERDLDK